jgi:peptidoglycan/LPS O-acetylase OafA/YrhL
MNFFVRLFRRETTSKEFIPVIDGLRFLAIAMVVLFHFDMFIRAKSVEVGGFADSTVQAFVPTALTVMKQGVELFFVISGFILAIPFMRYYLALSEKKPTLKKYYLRRVTRLEPPYMIAVLGLFFLQAFVFGSSYPLDKLTVSLFASLFYVHNLVFPGSLPLINVVFWSLEIEVQYYILAPFFLWALCRMKDKTTRRSATLLVIVFFAFLSWLMEVYWQVQTRTLLLYLQYFFSGILLCDIYLLDSEWLARLNRLWVFILGIALLVPILSVQLVYTENPLLRIAAPLTILAFYLIVFGNNWWRKIFSVNWVTLSGGMCYSIYLLFLYAIAAGGKLTLSRLHFDNFAVYFWVQLITNMLFVWSIAAVYFLLIEKPCMKPDWPRRLYQKLPGVKLTGEEIPPKNESVPLATATATATEDGG